MKYTREQEPVVEKKPAPVVVDPPMLEAEFLQIDKEVDAYRVKEGSDKQKVYKEMYGVDLTGKLLADGELEWMQFRGAIKLDKRFAPAVVIDKEGKNQYEYLQRRLQKYLWLKTLKAKGKLKAYEEVEPEPEVKAEDIPW